MTFPERGVAIIDALYARNVALAHGSEDDRRALTLKIAQQMNYEHSSRWGVKSRDKQSPQGKDGLAYLNVDGSMDIWDWQSGDTRERQISAGDAPTHPGIRDQHFIVVEQINHLSDDAPLPAPAPNEPLYPAPPQPVTPPMFEPLFPAILATLQSIDGRLASMQAVGLQTLEVIQAGDTSQVAAIEQLRVSVRDGVKQVGDQLAVFRGLGSLFRR